MRKYPLLSYLFALVLICGSVAFAATQWSVQPKESKLTFVGTQAGAEFEGAFERFTADIKFDPQDLAGSRFDVKVETASVNSRDSERDDTLKSDDFFAVKQFPTAHYVTERFTAKGGNKFTATGKLTLRNVTRDVPLEFTFEQKSGSAWLKGLAQLKRLEFGLGAQGDWKDTESVGNEVKVGFVLLLKQ
ncbi:MAG TPA: YceI family protein [Steroidobacteraceae bacterium]|jgi:polyisoprenoid-binding protein YceI